MAHAQSKIFTLLKQGDLLFQNLNCGSLCNAIEAVTYGVNNRDFSHCAMVVMINDTLKVVEAIGGVVQINTVNNFYKRSADTVIVKNITVMRLKQKFEYLIPKATKLAWQKVGTPYDDEFIMNNGALYCSELIYESFKYANANKAFFPLQPMTFKDPKTKQYFPAWITYYKELQKPIPEGMLGTNPGLLSRSNTLEIVK